MTQSVYGYLAQQIATRADAPAMSDSTGITLNYGALGAACDEVAEVLIANGVQSGDRVLLLSENCIAAVAVLFAAWKIGACVVPVNARQTGAEVARVIEHCEPSIVIMTTSVSTDAQHHAVRLNGVEVTGSYGSMYVTA